MSQAVNVNFKLDADVKKSMEQACSELGLSMSAAFTVFAKKVGREKRIPFEVSVDPFYSDSNIRYLENIVSDIKDGKAHFAHCAAFGRAPFEPLFHNDAGRGGGNFGSQGVGNRHGGTLAASAADIVA